MTPETIALALLIFSLVATRLWEEGQWRRGRFSDRTAALLVVGRLPVLTIGFALITGQDAIGVLAMAAIGLALAAAAYPYVVRRLRRSAGRD